MRLEFLFGTETGTAEVVCDDLKAAFPDHESAVANLENTNPASLKSGTLYVIVCSTFGTGDLPSSAISFHETLKESRPDLSNIFFAVFGLGDTTFGDTYGQGSEKLMDAMLNCNARMLGERVVADAAGEEFPEDIAVEWLKPLLILANAEDGLSAT